MIGKSLAHYEILSKLGEGGMGEVWKARDTTLDREVAIKVLPEVFAQDPERRARFEREARLLAQLNHPGIAAVHGLHEENGLCFIAMELVPGEDLACRLAKGPLPVDEAIKVGARVAEALEAAHEQGVIHRDLKPSNIVLMPGGAAKVLDFGLAKSMEESPDDSSNISQSPTLTAPGTMAGAILGTAAYMSPEQSRGKPLDKRTDIWAFGCVLYECLTGKSLFGGETVSDTIGAILHKDPDWTELPPGTPAAITLLLKRCLTRDRDHRLRDIGDARIEIGQALLDPSGSYLGLSLPEVSPGARGVVGRFRWLLAGVSGLVGIGVGIAVGIILQPAPEPGPLRKLDLGLVIENSGSSPARISPDGTKVVFTHRDRLWVQFLNELEPHALEETESARGPFWSPDSKQIAYFKESRLWRIPGTGGRSVAVAEVGRVSMGGYGGAWGDDGRIVYSLGNSGISSVPALGGEPKERVPLEPGDDDYHGATLLPDQKGMLFVLHPDSSGPNVLCVVRGDERKIFFRGETSERFGNPVYDPSGHVLFRRTGRNITSGIWALPFDVDASETTGEAFLVAPEAAFPSVSRDGTLAFVNGIVRGGNEQLYWADRTGRLIESVGEPRSLGNDLALSPDGRFLVFTTLDMETGSYDMWVRDMDRGTESRLTNNENRFEIGMTWSPDGRDILYSEFFSGMVLGDWNVWRVSADGSGEPIQMTRGILYSVAPDDKSLIVTRFVEPDSVGWSMERKRKIVRVPMDGSEGEEPVLRGADLHVSSGRVSPGGRLISYRSNTSGRMEIFVSRYPEGTGRWQVSVKGGDGAIWDPRGDRLYYHEETGIMEVMVERNGDDVRLGQPIFLFDLPSEDFIPSLDGERFLVVAQPQGEASTRISVKLVADWAQEFEKR